MAPNTSIDFHLIHSIDSVEEFLKETFHCSSNRLKKYFDKSFLNRALKAHAALCLPVDFVNDGLINPEYVGPDIEIIFEDENFLVINKPANIFVHPLKYSEKNNCLSFLRIKYPDLLKTNSTKYDRGLLYRLDFETSGVLVYVKEEKTYLYLRENFNLIAKKKIYRCVVEGECGLSGNFTQLFDSSGPKGRRVVVNNKQGLKGELSLKPISYNPKIATTLMEVELKTGLRHQIRAQLAFLGFPLHGDQFYGGKEASRLYLHAMIYEIEFNQKNYIFENIPSDFN